MADYNPGNYNWYDPSRNAELGQYPGGWNFYSGVPNPWGDGLGPFPGVNTPYSAGGGGGGGGGESGRPGGGGIHLPASVYYWNPNQYEQDWMNTFSTKNYGSWVDSVINKSYGALPAQLEADWNRILANPDTSMFAYPEESLAPLGRLGDIVSEYYGEARPRLVSAYQRDVLPVIGEQYAGPGYWGTARADAVSRSMGDMNDKLALAEAGDYSAAKKQGLLLDAQTRIGWDEMKRNYLGAWEQSKKQNLAQLITNADSMIAQSKAGLYAQQPQVTGATAAYSRQFEIPHVNPEFMAELSYYNMMLGQEPFNTAGWISQPDTSGWANLLAAAGTGFAGLGKNLLNNYNWTAPDATSVTNSNWNYDPGTGGVNLQNNSPYSATPGGFYYNQPSGNSLGNYGQWDIPNYGSSGGDTGTYWDPTDFGQVGSPTFGSM